MSERKSAVTVRIAGEEHVIRSDADPDYTRRCAQLVEERVAQIRDRVGALEGHRVAILAALSIADELLQLRERNTRREAEVAARADAFAERIESALSSTSRGSGPEPPTGE